MTGHHTHEHAPATAGHTLRWANLYDALVGVMTLGKGRAIRETTAEIAQIKTGDKVLDVGCGTGDLTFIAKAHAGAAGEVHGTDASPEMIEVARRKASQIHTHINFQEVGFNKIETGDVKFMMLGFARAEVVKN